MQLTKSPKMKTPKMKTPKKMNITKESKTPENKNTPKGKKNTPAPIKVKTPAKKNDAPVQSKNKTLQDMSEVRVYFPRATSYKQAVLAILKNTEDLRNPRCVSLLYKSPEAAKSQMEAISKIDVDGKKLRAQIVKKEGQTLKRIIYLKPDGSDAELARKHFGATSIEQKKAFGRPIPTHILTFKSDEAAVNASKKSLTLHERTLTLRPYFQSKDVAIKRKSESAEPKNAKKAKTEKKTLKMEVDEEDDDEDEEDDDEDEEDDDEEDDDEEEDEDEDEEESDDDDDEDDE